VICGVVLVSFNWAASAATADWASPALRLDQAGLGSGVGGHRFCFGLLQETTPYQLIPAQSEHWLGGTDKGTVERHAIE
jgi:hypothetical protein